MAAAPNGAQAAFSAFHSHEVDLELSPDGVADAPFEGAQGFFLGLPLRDLALVVDAPAV
jgi:hypothetical protein